MTLEATKEFLVVVLVRYSSVEFDARLCRTVQPQSDSGLCHTPPLDQANSAVHCLLIATIEGVDVVLDLERKSKERHRIGVLEFLKRMLQETVFPGRSISSPDVRMAVYKRAGGTLVRSPDVRVAV